MIKDKSGLSTHTHCRQSADQIETYEYFEKVEVVMQRGRGIICKVNLSWINRYKSYVTFFHKANVQRIGV